MGLPYEYFVGLRRLRPKRRRLFVSVITALAVVEVMGGVAALVIVFSVREGVADYMRDKLFGLSDHLSLVNLAEDRIRDADQLAAKVRQVPHVTGVFPFIQGQIIIQGRSGLAGASVRGIDPETAGSVMALEDQSIIVYGSLSELAPDYRPNPGASQELPPIGLEDSLAERIGAMIGDEVTLIAMDGELRRKPFRVGCVFKSGFREAPSMTALLSFNSASDWFQTEGKANGIAVKTDNLYTVDQTAREIREAVGGNLGVLTWEYTQPRLFKALKMDRFLSGIFLATTIVLACISTIAMLLTLAMDRHSDLTILQGLGATNRAIMRVFITQGTLIGTAGAILGVALGLSLCWVQLRYGILIVSERVFQNETVPIKITALNVIGVAIGAMVISFLTTLYPSWQAARMKPAESLRYE